MTIGKVQVLRAILMKKVIEMAVNTVIRDRRKPLGLPQEQVADYIGVSAPAANKWETGLSLN